jgi:hypothetical protein
VREAPIFKEETEEKDWATAIMTELSLREIKVVTERRMRMLFDAQFEALRANEDRIVMGWEDEKAQLMRRLAQTETELTESRRALAKLEGRYSSIKQTVTNMTQNYEHLYHQMKQQQNQTPVSAPVPGPVASSISTSSIVSAPASTQVNLAAERVAGATTSLTAGGKAVKTIEEERKVDGEAIPASSSVYAAAEQPSKIKRILSSRSAAAAVAAAYSAQSEKKRRLHESASYAQEKKAKEDKINGTSASSGPETEKPPPLIAHEAPLARMPADTSSSNAGATARQPTLSRPGSTGRQRPQGSTKPEPREQRYVQTNLTKAAREQLPGRTCDDCAAFYRMQKAKGISSQDIQSVLNTCSRHRQQWSPTTTPEGFWDMSVMSMPTPKPIKKRALDSGGGGGGGGRGWAQDSDS